MSNLVRKSERVLTMENTHALKLPSVQSQSLLLFVSVGRVDETKALRPSDTEGSLDDPGRGDVDASVGEESFERVVVHREGKRSNLEQNDKREGQDEANEFAGRGENARRQGSPRARP